MAVTAHYSIEDEHGNLLTRSRLVAFRHVPGTHSGPRLAEHLLEILKELGIVNKVHVCFIFTTFYALLTSK